MNEANAGPYPKAPGRPNNPNFNESANWYDEGYFKGRQDLAKSLKSWLIDAINARKKIDRASREIGAWLEVEAKLDELVGK